MDYKNTLLIPKTDFNMKAKLNIKEPQVYKTWQQNDIYNKMLNLNKNNKKFILHDGPPYANGNIHVGHALNKILKDFIIRYHLYSGFYSPFICGWDTHGLPIENAVLKHKHNRNKKLSRTEIWDLCSEYALKQVDNQIEQFSRLGLFTDFNKKYLTLNHDFEMQQLNLFLKMVKKNLVYRDMKPIYWSPSLASALAEAEIEYKELKSPSIYVTFTVKDGKNIMPKNSKIIIWTTTPWTIPANRLLAIGINIEYSLCKINKETYLVATDLIKKIADKLDWKDYKVIKKIIGQKLVNITTYHPIYNYISKVVVGHHVTTEAGTGIVHIAPGFGEDDYIIAKNNNIPIFVPIDDNGKYTKEIKDDDLEGIYYDNANKIISDKLLKNNSLLKLEFFNHSYPVDWRTKKPVIFRATKQWFVSIKKIKKDLLSEIDNVVWNQTWSKNNMQNMIKERNDWCISRQRYWGIPIISFYDQNMEPQFSPEIISYVISKIAKEGISIWFTKSSDELLPLKFRNKGWTKETDIMDVWFDSGSSNRYISEEFKLSLPFDLYLEGNDQFRGWFNSSLIIGVINNNKSPYKSLLTHGFVTDNKGYKMSKSLGNVVDPIKICNQYGADILRLWVLSTNYNDDVRIGENILKQISESYRKIRNTFKFLLGNLNDFKYEKNILPITKLSEVDKYILLKTNDFLLKARSLFENYKFNNFYLLLMNFLTNTLSAFYLDFIKDILYIETIDSLRRRQVQTTLFWILDSLLQILKPILVTTCEEAYSYFPKFNKKESIHLEKFNFYKIANNIELIAKWDKVIELREVVNRELELARSEKIIGKSLEAKLTICLNDEYKFLMEIKDLSQVLIVSEIEFIDSSLNLKSTKIGHISVESKQGIKCARCWMIVDVVKNDDICKKCYNNILILQKK